MFTKSDLRAGDVCVTRAGVVMIAQPNLNSFLCVSGWEDMYDFHDDLKHKLGPNHDIVKVYRPGHGSQCSFSHYAYSTAEVVYDEANPIETIPVVPYARTGSWDRDEWGSYVRFCSECNHRPEYSERTNEPNYTQYCPHCGSYMINYKELI